MPRANAWAALYGAKRKAIDRALLAECERMLAAPKIERLVEPIDFEDEERKRIARAFGRPVK